MQQNYMQHDELRVLEQGVVTLNCKVELTTTWVQFVYQLFQLQVLALGLYESLFLVGLYESTMWLHKLGKYMTIPIQHTALGRVCTVTDRWAYDCGLKISTYAYLTRNYFLQICDNLVLLQACLYFSLVLKNISSKLHCSYLQIPNALLCFHKYLDA